MAYVVSALPDYVEQNKTELLSKALFGSVTHQLFLAAGQIQTGVKKDTALNIVDTAINFQDGSNCGFNASGDDTFTQRTISAYPVKLNKKWCPRTLESKFTQVSLPKGSKYENLPFEQFFADTITGANAEEVEKLTWQGHREAVPGSNLEFADGFLIVLESASTVDASGATFTASNAIDVINEVYTKIPEALLTKNDLYIFLSPAYYRIWAMAITKGNYFNYTTDAGAAQLEMYLPGTNVKVKAIPGLVNSNKIVAGRLSNFVIGVDLEDEFEKIDIWYSKDNDEIRGRIDFKLGTQVAFPSEVVVYTVGS